MFKLLIEKELKEIITSNKFIITFCTCCVLILLTFFMGAKNYQINRNQYEASVLENTRQLEKNTDWFNVKHKIFMPPQPLSVLVCGISNDIGKDIQIYGRGELYAENSKYNDEPIYAIFRFLDLEFLFQVILSLFAILFAYNSINGEKESGTLRLTFANPVPRSKYILAKLVGSFIALTLPLIIPILIGCLLFSFMGVPFSSDDWLKLIFIIISGFLYFGVFLTLSIMVSTLTHKSSNSFILLLVIWIFSVLIIPRTAVLIAGRAVGVPSVDEVSAQKSKFSSELWKEDREQMKAFKPKSQDNIMQEFQQFMQENADKRDKKMREFSEKINTERQNKQVLQEVLAFSIARISPAAIFSLTASSLAGTSISLKNEYLKQSTEYQKSFAEFQKKKTGGTTGGGGMIIRLATKDDSQRQKSIDVKEMPEFKFTPPKFSSVIGSSIYDLLLLFLFNILFFIITFVRFKKYDLR